MRSFYALMVIALSVAGAAPLDAQTTPAPSPTPLLSPAPVSTAAFTAPQDWVQLPRGFTLTELKNVLRGTKKSKMGGGIFVQAVLPVPSGLVAAALLQLRSALSKSKTKISASTKSLKICGSTANVSTVRIPGGRYPAIVETTLLTQHGLTYATVYARDSSAPDAGIESAVRATCPLPGGGLPEVVAPSGWTHLQKGLDFQLAGIWLGNSPLQIMTLLQGQGIPNLSALSQMAPQKISNQQKGVKYNASVKHVKFCGTNGLLVSAQMIVPPGFGMTYSFAAAQGTLGTFLLSYFHPSSYTDPGAQQSLKTLCAGAPLPNPSSSPLPFP